MKGGPSVKVLLDFALGEDIVLATKALDILKTQVFLYDADTSRIEEAFKKGNNIAKQLLESYAQAEFFTNLPEIEEEIEVVTYVAAEGDISTDLLFTSFHWSYNQATQFLAAKAMSLALSEHFAHLAPSSLPTSGTLKLGSSLWGQSLNL